MKKTLFRITLIAASLTACLSATAQTDTIFNKQPRYHYNEWYDTVPCYFESCNINGYPSFYMRGITHYDTGDVAKEQFSADPIAVKGIAVMVSMNRRNMYEPYDPLFTAGSPRAPEYVMLAYYDSLNNEMVIVSDSLRWDTAVSKVMMVDLCSDSLECCFHDCYIYEAFFTKPPVVDSSFFIVATNKSNVRERTVAWQWHPYQPTLYTGIGFQGSIHYTPYPRIDMREFEKFMGEWKLWRNGTTGKGYYWGGFFPIVDYDTIVVESADITMGSANGGGRYSDQTNVTITATPEPGFYFRCWNDGNTVNPRTVFLTQDTHFIAHFTDSIPFYVTAQPDLPLHGQVTGGGTYWPNDTAHLSAIPNERYRFIGWDDGDTANPRSAVITQDTAFTALFEWDDQHEGIAVPGKDEEGQQLFTLTPNPAHGSVTVTLAVQPSNATLTLADASGRELLTLKATAPTLTIPLAPYPAGTYFLTLRTPDAASTQRLVVK